MKARIARRLREWLVSHGVLATPEEDLYFSWADARLDEIALAHRLRDRDARETVEQLDALGIIVGSHR